MPCSVEFITTGDTGTTVTASAGAPFHVDATTMHPFGRVDDWTLEALVLTSTGRRVRDAVSFVVRFTMTMRTGDGVVEVVFTSTGRRVRDAVSAAGCVVRGAGRVWILCFASCEVIKILDTVGCRCVGRKIMPYTNVQTAATANIKATATFVRKGAIVPQNERRGVRDRACEDTHAYHGRHSQAKTAVPAAGDTFESDADHGRRSSATTPAPACLPAYQRSHTPEVNIRSSERSKSSDAYDVA